MYEALYFEGLAKLSGVTCEENFYNDNLRTDEGIYS